MSTTARVCWGRLADLKQAAYYTDSAGIVYSAFNAVSTGGGGGVADEVGGYAAGESADGKRD